MNREEFLRKVFNFFGKNDENLLKTYEIALTTKEQTDWDKLFNKVITEAESRYLPAPKWFIEKMPLCRLEQVGQYKYDSGTSVLKLKDRFYTYDMWHVTHTLEEIERNFKKKYGDNFVSFKYYPDEYTIIGNKIYLWQNGKQNLVGEI